jgi:alpha-D-xyloside xylohydrolase
MSFFTIEKDRLIREYRGERLWIEPWGENSLRVRATRMAEMDDSPLMQWALLPRPETRCEIQATANTASIANGGIRATVDGTGRIRFFDRKGKLLLEEFERTKEDLSGYCSDLNIKPREFSPIPGGDYALTVRFEASDSERLYGMGQYQQPYLDLKGCTLELAQRNSQASVPFLLSSCGYGFLWNNPGIGQASFCKNVTEWSLRSTRQMDYWITAGDSPAEIEEAFADAVGKAPMMPDFATGFWQCKLRYRTQDELMGVARDYKRRNLPISVIVIDFFHWPNQGTWMFDEEYWPDPKGMVDELKEMGIELMVSVWPTVDSRTSNHAEMKDLGLLVTSDKGPQVQMTAFGNQSFIDTTNPRTREYVWDKIKKNYYDKGIRVFWLDEAEPEYDAYTYDNYRYSIGPNVQIGNIYPLLYSKLFHDGMQAEGQENILNLIRCAWAGSQRYGALVWSGDIHSSFRSLRCQLAAGLNMGIAGIPWWTTDIGGFYAGNVEDDAFKECLVRWFQYAVFCPVFRLHGDRRPAIPPLTDRMGGGMCRSGAPNEVWSYGDQVYGILVRYLFMRERLRPYIKVLMEEAHEKGTPPMRPLFYDFQDDPRSWEVEDQYMFGKDILVAPVMEQGMTERSVYLPAGACWKNAYDGAVYDGGSRIACPAPLDIIPVFLRDGIDLPVYGEIGDSVNEKKGVVS